MNLLNVKIVGYGIATVVMIGKGIRKMFKREKKENEKPVKTEKTMDTKPQKDDKKDSLSVLKYRDENGVIHDFDMMDRKAFDEVMSNRNNRLILS